MENSDQVFACESAESEEKHELFIKLHSSSESFKILGNNKNFNLDAYRANNCMSLSILSSLTEKCEEQVSQCMHVPNLLMHESQSQNIEQKQAVDDISDKIFKFKNISFSTSRS